jgi:PKD repeat protein
MAIEPGILFTPAILLGDPYLVEQGAGVYSPGELLEPGTVVFSDPYVSVSTNGVSLPGFLLSQYQLLFGDYYTNPLIPERIFYPGVLVQVSARPGLVSDTGLLLVLGFYVDFSGTPRLGFKGQSVQFTDETYGTFIASWYWEFGDGSTSNLQNPSHVYVNNGFYSVRLRVTSTNGDVSEVYKVNYIRITALPGSSISGTKEIFGFKLEGTPYTPETLTNSDYRYPVYDVKVAPDIEMYTAQSSFGNYSKVPSIAGKRSCAINFSVDLYTMTDLATAPAYFTLLQACGWKQTTHAIVGVSVKPNQLYNSTPATIEVVYEDDGDEPTQTVYKISGAMGNTKIIGEVGKPLRIEFSFIGSLEGITTRAFADRIVPVAFDDAVPLPYMEAIVRLYGNETNIEGIEINGNEVINLFSNINTKHGYSGAHVIDHYTLGTLTTNGDSAYVCEIENNIENSIIGALFIKYGDLTISSECVQIIKLGDDLSKLQILFLNNDVNILQGQTTDPGILTETIIELDSNIELEGDVEL